MAIRASRGFGQERLTRFRVLVLVPVIFFAAAIIIATGFMNGFSVSALLVALVVMLVSLEFGYLAGCFGAAYLLSRIKLRFPSAGQWSKRMAASCGPRHELRAGRFSI